MALLIISPQALNSPLADCHLEIFFWVTVYSFYNLKHSIVLRVFPKLCERVHIQLAGPVL